MSYNTNPLRLDQFSEESEISAGAFVVGYDTKYPGINTRWSFDTLKAAFGASESDAQIQYLITTSGQTYSASDNTQAAKAVSNYQANSGYYVDTGTADAYVLERQSGQLFSMPTQLIDGLTLDFIPANDNTTASTVTFLTLTKAIKMNISGADVAAGFIKAGGVYSLTYIAGSNYFVIKAAPAGNADWNASSGPFFIANKPTIPAAQVNSDWNASSGVAEILNKPTIPAAQQNSDWNASSGVTEILNKPTIPAAQIQSDWTQANPAALDFIKNKPAGGRYLFADGEITLTAPAASNSALVTGILTTDSVIATIKTGASGTIGLTGTSVLGACYADGTAGRVYITSPYPTIDSSIVVYYQVWR